MKCKISAIFPVIVFVSQTPTQTNQSAREASTPKPDFRDCYVYVTHVHLKNPAIIRPSSLNFLLRPSYPLTRAVLNYLAQRNWNLCQGRSTQMDENNLFYSVNH